MPYSIKISFFVFSIKKRFYFCHIMSVATATKENIPKILNQIIDRLTGNLDISKVIMFGSYAYGAPEDDSDIDLVVVSNKRGFCGTYKERAKQRLQVKEFLRDLNIPVDLFVYTIDEWNKLLESKASFFKQINEHGISLYARKD